MRRLCWYRQAFVIFFLSIPLTSVRAGDRIPSARQCGTEILSKIQTALYMPRKSLYAEQFGSGKLSPSWTWDASMQLGALCSAARIEPEAYLPQVRAYAIALRSYRTNTHDRPGFDVNPGPKNPDRYYDDNAWICLALLETYGLTRDPKDLAYASDAYRFALSGEDASNLDGGIYWHEDQTKSKNACSSGPVMLDALAFYDITREAKHLDTAKRLYDWTCSHLQDTDGLVFDSIGVSDAKVNKSKFTYNTATLIRAACGLYRATHEKKYLDEARRVAKASEKRFVRTEDGIIAGAGKLGVKLLEAYIDLYETDHDDHWKAVVTRCLISMHSHRSEAGWYPTALEDVPPPASKPVRLIDQAAPARAFWFAAAHGIDLQ